MISFSTVSELQNSLQCWYLSSPTGQLDEKLSHIGNDCTSQNNFTVKGTASGVNNKYPIVTETVQTSKNLNIVKILFFFVELLFYPKSLSQHASVAKVFGFVSKNKSHRLQNRKAELNTSIHHQKSSFKICWALFVATSKQTHELIITFMY